MRNNCHPCRMIKPLEVSCGECFHTAKSRICSDPPNSGATTSIAQHPSIASARFRGSSSMVSPCEVQPGMAGPRPNIHHPRPRERRSRSSSETVPCLSTADSRRRANATAEVRSPANQDMIASSFRISAMQRRTFRLGSLSQPWKRRGSSPALRAHRECSVAGPSSPSWITPWGCFIASRFALREDEP